MLVVADTSPIHVLVRVGHVEILPGMFGTVVIPTVVAKELAHASYEQVRTFMRTPPAWIDVREAQVVERIPTIHAGEEAAISLARELAADVLLIDDYEGRRAASSRGVAILGTLGVVERAATVGLVDLQDALDSIRQTDFRVSDAVIQAIIERHRQRPG
jgi:predicted nucleic acid-binding protein